MKRIILISVPAALLVLVLAAFSAGFRNYRNFKKLAVGMEASEVVERMGTPGHIIENEAANTSIYLYQPPFYYVSDQIGIIIQNDDKRVIKLVEPQ